MNDKDERSQYGGAIGPILRGEPVEVPTMALSRRRWKRLKDECDEAEMGWTELWLGVAFASLGAGITAWITFWALPGPDTHDLAHVSSHAQDLLRWIGSSALAVGIVCLVAWLDKRRAHNAALTRLRMNMESDQHFTEDELPNAT